MRAVVISFWVLLALNAMLSRASPMRQSPANALKEKFKNLTAEKIQEVMNNPAKIDELVRCFTENQCNEEHKPLREGIILVSMDGGRCTPPLCTPEKERLIQDAMKQMSKRYPERLLDIIHALRSAPGFSRA
ncbi:uncharacterized protein LOC143038246 [Oratosquilla oratoria]|uniref:uncharacterized protein LOC143038246 n=1 Tax=Oratosquilla oratoria TaxID=337810 RepID=UPI003F760082